MKMKERGFMESEVKNYEECDDLVTKIPANCCSGATIPLNVRSYAGYADTEDNNQLFYWFFESQQCNPKHSRDAGAIENTPLAIWLNGGPGAPSTLGLFLENGPYRMMDTAAGELIANEYTWNQNMHIMYWDQPFGAGYSPVIKGNYADSEDELSESFYSALQSFFAKHPEYRNCPLYVMGESYAGKYVPNIAAKIDAKNNAGSAPFINLKGIAVGDGWIDSRLQIKILIDYAFALGYLDRKQKEQLTEGAYKIFCDALDSGDWKQAYRVSNGIVDTVSAMGGGFNVYDIRSFSDISMDNVRTYMELPQVKKALHIPLDQSWEWADNSGPVAEHLIRDNMVSSEKVYSDLIGNTALEVLMYTGTFDTACGSWATEEFLWNLPKWNHKDDSDWQQRDREVWAQPSGNTKGFIKQYKNLTQIVLPNSGHQVPYFLPAVSREMIYKWIKGESFPSHVVPVEAKSK